MGRGTQRESSDVSENHQTESEHDTEASIEDFGDQEFLGEGNWIVGKDNILIGVII